MFEREACLKSGKLLFSEHEALEITGKSPKIYYEELSAYLTKAVDEKFMTRKEATDRALVTRMLEKRDWDENTIKAFDLDSEYKRILTKEDSKAKYYEKQRKLRLLALELENVGESLNGAIKEDFSDDGEIIDEFEDEDVESNVQLKSSKDGIGLGEKTMENEEENQEKEKEKDDEIKDKKERPLDTREEKRAIREGLIDSGKGVDADAERKSIMAFLMKEKEKIVGDHKNKKGVKGKKTKK